MASRFLRKLLCGCVDAADERHPQPKGGLFYGLPAGFQFGREGDMLAIYDEAGRYIYPSEAYREEVVGVDASLDRLRLGMVNKSSTRLPPPRIIRQAKRGFQGTTLSVITEKSSEEGSLTFSSRKGVE
ncbi:MAG: hypothetical protein M1831_004931 [Alyxoria varia]|nr:MAG: hypothetical protein M1831_004931 [Alyxoria varia]